MAYKPKYPTGKMVLCFKSITPDGECYTYKAGSRYKVESEDSETEDGVNLYRCDESDYHYLDAEEMKSHFRPVGYPSAEKIKQFTVYSHDDADETLWHDDATHNVVIKKGATKRTVSVESIDDLSAWVEGFFTASAKAK
jgi:hypothetical protein